MSTRSAARKTESWKDFLYSDPEGFIVQTVKFASGTTGRLFVKKQFEAQEFLLSYWGPRRATQVANFDYVMEVQEGKDTVFIDTSDETNSGLARFINDKDKSVAANCRKRFMTTRADHIASSWQLVLFFQVSLNFQIVEQSSVMFPRILK